MLLKYKNEYSLSNQIQEDIMCYLDGMDNTIIDGVCEIVSIRMKDYINQ